MACRTGKVEHAVEKTKKALKEIKKLEEMLVSQETSMSAEFKHRIDDKLNAIGIHDEEVISSNSYTKTEYSSEFSLDKISTIVTTALGAAKTALQTPDAIISDEAIDAYSDVVIAIAEAAKSSSSSSSSLSFSMNRLFPGAFAFVFAKSYNVRDKDTFGEEAVTATMIQYVLVRSMSDFQKFGGVTIRQLQIETQIEYYKKFLTLQVGLMEDLASNKITFEEFEIKDQLYAKKAQTLKKRAEEAIFNSKEEESLVKSMNVASTANLFTPPTMLVNANYDMLQTSIESLRVHGGDVAKAINLAEERIQKGYFG